MAPHRPHLEGFILRDRPDRIYVSCDCPIGRNHNYIDWLRLPENENRLRRALDVWAVPT